MPPENPEVHYSTFITLCGRAFHGCCHVDIHLGKWHRPKCWNSFSSFYSSFMSSSSSQIGKRVEVVKTLLMDAITECRYRSPSLTLLDDLDTLCHRGSSQELGYAEENYLTRYLIFNYFAHSINSTLFFTVRYFNLNPVRHAILHQYWVNAWKRGLMVGEIVVSKRSVCKLQSEKCSFQAHCEKEF